MASAQSLPFLLSYLCLEKNLSPGLLNLFLSKSQLKAVDKNKWSQEIRNLFLSPQVFLENFLLSFFVNDVCKADISIRKFVSCNLRQI
jgi:hypothetical protein